MVNAGDTDGDVFYKIDFNDLAGVPGVAITNPTTVNNVITIDKVPPTLAKVAEVSTPTNNETPTFIFYSTKPGIISSSFDLSGSVPLAAVLGNNSVILKGISGSNGLSSGVYNGHTVTVTDGTGNSTSLGIPSFEIDLSGAELEVVTAITTPTRDKTPTFIFKSTKKGIITSTLDFSTTTSAIIGDNIVIFNELPEGPYNNKTIIVTDSAGNATTLSIGDFTVNLNAIILTTLVPITTPSDGATLEFTFYSSSVGLVTSTLDISGSDAVVIGSNIITFNSLPEGTYSQHSIMVGSKTLLMDTFVIDTTAPMITITAIAKTSFVGLPERVLFSGEKTNDANIMLTFTASEDISGFTYDDVDISGGTGTLTTVLWPSIGRVFTAKFIPNQSQYTGGSDKIDNKLITVSISAATFQDLGGLYNTVATPGFSWTIDNNIPVLTLTPDSLTIGSASGRTLASEGDSISLTFTASKVITPIVTFKSGGVNFNSSNTPVADNPPYSSSSVNGDGKYVWTFDYMVNSSDTDGDVFYKIEFNDEFGNIGTPIVGPPLSANGVIVDTVAPVLSFVTQITTPSNNRNPSFILHSTKHGTITSNLSINWTQVGYYGNNSILFSQLDDGDYATGSITMTDAAGNIGTLNIPFFKIFTTKPNVTITSQISTPTNDRTPSLTFTSDVPGTVITNVPGGFSSSTVVVVGDNTVTFNQLLDGTYKDRTLTVIDILGNLTTTPLTEFIIDTTPPTMEITAEVGIASVTGLLNGGVTNEITANLIFTTSEDISGFTINHVDVSGGGLYYFSGSGQKYTATFEAASGNATDGTVVNTVRVDNNKFKDLRGVYNTMATADFSWTIDNVSPTIDITSQNVQSGGRTNEPFIILTFTTSEYITGFDSGDVEISGGSLAKQIWPDAGNVYTAKITHGPASSVCSAKVSASKLCCDRIPSQLVVRIRHLESVSRVV